MSAVLVGQRQRFDRVRAAAQRGVVASGRWVWWLARETAQAEMRGATRTGRAMHQWSIAAADYAAVEATVAKSEADDVKEARDGCRKLARDRKERAAWLTVMVAALLVGAAILAGPLLVAAATTGVLGLVFLLVGLRQPELAGSNGDADDGQVSRERFTAALGALGYAKLDDALKHNPDGRGVVRRIRRDGPGTRIDADLPPGITVPMIAARREELASGLRYPLSCVWPGGDPGSHAARLVTFIAHQELARMRQPRCPLLDMGRVDLFEPVPFGTDVRGQPVTVPLVETNLLIGSLPGAGKSSSLRLPLLAAALDPRAELRVFDLKGTGDLAPLARVADEYAAGADEDTLESCLATLREAHAELDRRAQVIRRQPQHHAPQSKVTPALAADPELGLHPLVVAVDEVQELLVGHGKASNKIAHEAATKAEAIIKRGRALGVVLILATQRPDANSLPTGIRDNVGTRFCLRVMDHTANDMILGAGAYQAGIRATSFKASDRGVGYLLGASDEPQVVRTYNIDLEAAGEVVMRAALLRQQHTTPPELGTAGGEGSAVDPVVAASLEVLNGDREVSIATLLQRLQAAGHCDEWDVVRLGTELTNRGVARPPRKRLQRGNQPTSWIGRQHLEGTV